jgi:CBS domain-containing protein
MAETIRDVMTSDVRTCSADSTLIDAATIMRQDDIGDVLVVKEDGTLCGIITDRDIVVRALADGRDPTTTRIDDVCTHDLVSVAPDSWIGEAVELMTRHAVRRLPVTDGGKLVGVVSIGDLAMDRDPASALAEISAAPGDR